MTCQGNKQVRIRTRAWKVAVSLLSAVLKGTTVSVGLPGGAAPTAVRLAYYDNPACPAAYDTFHLPGNKPYWCLDPSYDVTKPGSGYDPVNQCRLYSSPSDLPAVPFTYEIKDNKCVTAGQSYII